MVLTGGENKLFSRMFMDPEIPIREIAARFGKSENWVYLHALRLDLPPASSVGRRHKNGRPDYSPHYEAMLRDRKSGMSFADIARKYGCANRTVRCISERQNWPAELMHKGFREGGPEKTTVRSKRREIRLPDQSDLETCFALRRLDSRQISAVAKTGGAYAELEKLARRWKKGRNFVLACWHEYKAVV